MNHTVQACNNFWKDLKDLQKKFHLKELYPTLEMEEETDDQTRISFIPLLNAITTFFSNTCSGGTYSTLDLWNNQPYIDKGWKIWKFRYGFAGKGQRDGLRVIMAENEEHKYIIAVLIKPKNECTNEKAFQKEVLTRLEDLLGE